MNNVKVVHTKETIMANNNFTKVVTRKQSKEKMLQKYAARSQKNTHADVRVQPKPGDNNIEMTRLHKCSP